jgi:hypothetical protein
MRNPRPTVVERCPAEADRQANVQFILPAPASASSPIDGLHLDIEAGFITGSEAGWLLDPDLLSASWIEG